MFPDALVVRCSPGDLDPGGLDPGGVDPGEVTEREVALSAAATERLSQASLIFFDLVSGIDPAAVVAIGPPVIAYGPHVESDALATALGAGCAAALPRSVFFRRLSTLRQATLPQATMRLAGRA